MEDRLSSCPRGWLTARPRRPTIRSGEARLVLRLRARRYLSHEDLVRGLPHLLAPAAPPDLLRHGEVLGDDGPGLLPAHRPPVGVAHDVGLPTGQDHPAPLGQM